MAIGSLCNSVAFMAPHDAHSIFPPCRIKQPSLLLNSMFPNIMHNCKMSSSVIEETSNGVPSLCVTINMHIHVLRTGSSVGTGSLPEAVAIDEVDIFNKKFFGVMT